MFMLPSESEFLLSHISSDMDILEYGSGYSTLQISKHCRKLFSVEHQESWYNSILEKINLESITNVEYLLKRPNLPFEEYFCGSFEEFKDYIMAPVGKKFDLIFIDGRARIDCAKFSHLFSKENTFVFFHDFSSRMNDKIHHYKDALEYLDLIDSVDDMSKFKIKKRYD